MALLGAFFYIVVFVVAIVIGLIVKIISLFTSPQSNRSYGSTIRYIPSDDDPFYRRADPILDQLLSDYRLVKNSYRPEPADEYYIRSAITRCVNSCRAYWAIQNDMHIYVSMRQYMRTRIGAEYDPCMDYPDTLEAQLDQYAALDLLGSNKANVICDAIMDRLTEKGSIMRCRLGTSGIGGASKEQLTACHSLLMRQGKVSEYKYNNRYYITFPGWDHDRVLAYVQDRASKEASAPPATAPAQLPPLQWDRTGLAEDILRFLDFGGDIPRQELLTVPFPSYTSAQVAACYDALLQGGLVREYPKGKTAYASVTRYDSDGSPASSHQSNPSATEAEASPAHTPGDLT